MTYRLYYQDADHVRHIVTATDNPWTQWYFGDSCRSHTDGYIRITRIERINP